MRETQISRRSGLGERDAKVARGVSIGRRGDSAGCGVAVKAIASGSVCLQKELAQLFRVDLTIIFVFRRFFARFEPSIKRWQHTTSS